MLKILATACLPLMLWHGARSEPLSLQQVVELSLQRQPVLQRLQGRVTEAAGARQEAEVLGHPTLGFTAGYLYNNPALAFQVAGTHIDAVVPSNWSATLSLRQVIATFGRLHWNVELTELLQQSAASEAAYGCEQIREQAQVRFYEVHLRQRQVGVQRDDLAAREAQLQQARGLVQNGAAPGYDVRRTLAAAARSQQLLTQAQSDERAARASLGELLGRPAGELELAAPPDESPPPPPSDAEADIERALAQRLDLQAARQAVDAGQARVEASRAVSRPTLAFQSDYGRRNPVGFQPGQLWSTGLVLSLPIFDGGLSDARVTQSEGALAEARAVLEAGRRGLRAEAEVAHAQLQADYSNLAVSATAEQAAGEAARIARARYLNGVSPLVERLDAEAAWTQARQDALASRFHYRQSWAHWQRVVAL